MFLYLNSCSQHRLPGGQFENLSAVRWVEKLFENLQGSIITVASVPSAVMSKYTNILQINDHKQILSVSS